MHALRDGANVVVGASAPFAAALSCALEDRIAHEWRLTGPLAPSDLPPLNELYAALEVDDNPSKRRSVAALLAGIESKRVIMVTGVGALQWPAWQLFLNDFAHVSRSFSAMDRTQLLLITAGVPKTKLPKKAPALIAFIWDGVVGEADVFSYVTQALRQKGIRIDAQAKLSARIITRLALWDFDLVDHLVKLDARELFDPSAVVCAACNNMAALQQLGNTWEEGGLAEFDGEPLKHAAAILKEDDPQGELAMRLWAAQAAELLPALEIKRRQLANRMKAARMPLPIRLNDELIHDLADVEIGSLLHLARTHRLPRDIQRIAEKFKGLRNKLAHLCPLEAEEALDPEVLAVR